MPSAATRRKNAAGIQLIGDCANAIDTLRPEFIDNTA
jgi:hypothetical protein